MCKWPRYGGTRTDGNQNHQMCQVQQNSKENYLSVLIRIKRRRLVCRRIFIQQFQRQQKIRLIRKFSVKDLSQCKNKNTQITNNLSQLENFVQIKSDPVTAHRSDFFAAEQPGAIQISNQIHETSASSNFPDFTVSSRVTD
jgi:hypothetical protein